MEQLPPVYVHSGHAGKGAVIETVQSIPKDCIIEWIREVRKFGRMENNRGRIQDMRS